MRLLERGFACHVCLPGSMEYPRIPSVGRSRIRCEFSIAALQNTIFALSRQSRNPSWAVSKVSIMDGNRCYGDYALEGAPRIARVFLPLVDEGSDDCLAWSALEGWSQAALSGSVSSMEYLDWGSGAGDFSVRWRPSNGHADDETIARVADLLATVAGSGRGWTFTPFPEMIESSLAWLTYDAGVRFADEAGTWSADEAGVRLTDKAEVLSADQADEELLEAADCLSIPRVSTLIDLARFADLWRGRALPGVVQFGEEVRLAAPPYGDSVIVSGPESIVPVGQELGLDLRVVLANQAVPPMEW